MRKNQASTYTRQWAMAIVAFARSKDETRYNLRGFNLEPDGEFAADGFRRKGRLVATDGCRLAWQEYAPCPPDGTKGLIDEHGQPLAGEFPDYKTLLPGPPNIVFQVSSDGDWLAALKTIAHLNKRPFGELAYDGERLIVSLKLASPNVMATLMIPLAAGEPKPFKLGIHLAWLWDAIDAARRSDGRGRWYVRVSLVDHMSPIQIDNEHGFYSITMPCLTEGAFCWSPETEQAESTEQAA
jgi:DNA polymerase III sliding clamp (beta) subunit (PCNA family)